MNRNAVPTWIGIRGWAEIRKLGYLPFPQAGGALLFHLLSELNKHSRAIITTNPMFAGWASVFADAKMTTALLDRLTHHCRIVETANESLRFRHSTNTAKARIKSREQAMKSGRTGSSTWANACQSR